jgi:hypothetical protein
MAGLNIGAPASLEMGGRVAQAGGASTPLVRDPSEASVPYLFWLFCQGGLPAVTRAKHEGQQGGRAVPAGDVVSRERSRRLLQPQMSRYRGEQGFSACAGGVGSIRQSLSRSLNEVGTDTGGIRRTGSEPAVRRSGQVLTTRGWSLPVMRERNEDRRLVQVTILGAVDPGGCSGGRPTSHASEAQCQCTTASQGTAGHATSQAW